MPFQPVRRSANVNDPTSDDQSATQADDVRIVQQIAGAIAEHPDLASIEVSSQGAFVTLSGVTTTLRAKVHAELLASRIPGVVDIDNQIVVGSGPTKRRTE